MRWWFFGVPEDPCVGLNTFSHHLIYLPLLQATKEHGEPHGEKCVIFDLSDF